VTEIYYPIKPKEIPTYKRVIKDSITPTTTPSAPTIKKEDLSEF
jgi:hypothetical protein